MEIQKPNNHTCPMKTFFFPRFDADTKAPKLEPKFGESSLKEQKANIALWERIRTPHKTEVTPQEKVKEKLADIPNEAFRNLLMEFHLPLAEKATDYQDFHENLYVLRTAMELGLHPKICWDEIPDPEGALLLGALPENKKITDHFNKSLKVEKVWENPVFLKHCNRHFEFFECKEGSIELAQRLLDLNNKKGIEKFTVKWATHKGGIMHFHLNEANLDGEEIITPPNSKIPQKTETRLPDAENLDEFIYQKSFETKAGFQSRCMIQECVQMEHEYRMCIVNGKLLCGAGCITELTPNENQGDLFDPRTQQTRDEHNFDKVEENPAIINQYIEDLKPIIEEMKKMGHKTYNIDVCQIQGKTSIIEMHGLSHLGLYAMNYKKLLGARVKEELKKSKEIEGPNL
jgi:hypothetical protein